MKKTTLHRALGIAFATASAALALAGCDGGPASNRGSADPPQAASPGASPAALTYDDLVAIVKDPDDYAKARKLGTILPDLGPESIPAVKDVLEEAAELQMGAVEFELLMNYWATHDPAAAGWYAVTTSPRAFRVAAIYGALTRWAQTNPQEAIENVRAFAMEKGDFGVATQIALVRGWYASGKPGLVEYIRDLGAGFERQRALAAYANVLIRDKGVEEAVRWAEAVPDEDETYKIEVYRNVATAIVPFDLAAAREFCDAHCEGPHGSNLRVRIASRWAREDPASAVEWLAKAPDNKETDLAVRVAYALWGKDDRAGAVSWMKSKIVNDQIPEWLEPALPIYARLVGRENATEGVALAGRIENERSREETTIDVLREWRFRDEAAAEAWLKTSSLSPELLERVREPETPLERRTREELAKLTPKTASAAKATP